MTPFETAIVIALALFVITAVVCHKLREPDWDTDDDTDGLHVQYEKPDVRVLGRDT